MLGLRIRDWDSTVISAGSISMLTVELNEAVNVQVEAAQQLSPSEDDRLENKVHPTFSSIHCIGWIDWMDGSRFIEFNSVN